MKHNDTRRVIDAGSAAWRRRDEDDDTQPDLSSSRRGPQRALPPARVGAARPQTSARAVQQLPPAASGKLSLSERVPRYSIENDTIRSKLGGFTVPLPI